MFALRTWLCDSSLQAAGRIPIKMAGPTNAKTVNSCLDQFQQKQKPTPSRDTWIDDFILRLSQLLKAISLKP